jgi:hypothetical protein
MCLLYRLLVYIQLYSLFPYHISSSVKLVYPFVPAFIITINNFNWVQAGFQQII